MGIGNRNNVVMRTPKTIGVGLNIGLSEVEQVLESRSLHHCTRSQYQAVLQQPARRPEPGLLILPIAAGRNHALGEVTL